MCEEYDKNYIENTKSLSNDDKTIYTRLIVKAASAIDEYGAIDSIYGFGYAFLQYADESTAKEALNNYKDSGYIADYDSLVTCMDSANHNQWGDNWAYERVDADSALDYYKLKVKTNINIAVVDSGINYNHELFKNRIVRTKYNISSTGAENDEIDDYGHGTEVSGVIANSTPSNVKISSYKIMDGSGKGNYSAVVSACAYMMELSNRPDVVNFSLGLEDGEVIMETVIDELVNSGITVVAAAGNDNREVYETPGKCENAITVAAFDYYDKPCSFTNYGGVVDISAPGEYIYTADMSSNNAYTFSLGTSLATPFVSAAAAYVLMENKNYTPEQVKQELIATATPFKRCDCRNLYGAGIVNFSNIINGSRCKSVTANFESGVYREDISVVLKCDNSLVDIYYTTDGTMPTKTNGIKYSAPINLTESTRIIAAAFARAGTPMHSKFTYFDYYIFKNGESEYVIDNNGTILNYLGNNTALTVPETINGIAPTSISQKCFQSRDISSIVLPNTVKTIGENAFCNTNLESITSNGVTEILKHSFYGCDMLSSIEFPELRYIGREALFGCELLTGDLKLPALERVGEKGLAGTYFKSVKLPKCAQADDYAFENCTAQDIVLNNVTTVGIGAFNNCKNLENLYVPKVKGLGLCFEGCTNLKMIFAPMTSGFSASIPSNATIYCSDELTSVSFPKEYADYKCTIVAPESTYGLNVADLNGHKNSYIYINSDEIAQSKGAQIRTRDNGLRFGFALDENNIGFDFRKYAENIDYGFVYTYESLDGLNDFQINYSLRVDNSTENHKRTADKRNIDGTVSTYNAVFTRIPASHYDDKISARAYICIDGMYFYSPVMTRSFNDVATAVLADDEIDQNTKNEVKTLLEKEV